MKISQLEQILEVAKTGSISQAAANLYMAQPNLSLSLKKNGGGAWHEAV